MFTITPMVVAKGPNREKSRFTYMHNFGETVNIPYVAWLIQGKGMNVLVDSGCSAEDYAAHIRSQDGPLILGGEVFADVIGIKPITQHLTERGLGVDDIDILIQTHLDWDHCMNTKLFKKSKIMLQRAEWAKVPFHSMFKSTYAPKFIYDEISTLNLDLVEGDYNVTKGLDVIFTPGHSPGGQSVIVETKDGPYVIAGMCTIKDNFYPPEDVKARGYRVIATGMHVDPIQCYDSMIRLLEVGGNNVLPFHDEDNFTMGTIG